MADCLIVEIGGRRLTLGYGGALIRLLLSLTAMLLWVAGEKFVRLVKKWAAGCESGGLLVGKAARLSLLAPLMRMRTKNLIYKLIVNLSR
jgi:hypothetical protein